ncbi:hypothetical protein [Sabulicella glaciei]|uniref:Uncharacterized protein n=1 Tax=Sabulicella glaciei TaxID=2984948 RepID=A0ABT3NZG3_9PROT|nr:hypothetical protein [Roseococcus sp. MDT2-1-1]MCW8087539.1 hypothetical protein [Roseococcus sp. MDT2-1-1]
MRNPPEAIDPAAPDDHVPFDRLTEAERAEALTRMRENFRNPGPDIRAFYATIGQRTGASGIDEKGRLVRQRADGSLEVLKE